MNVGIVGAGKLGIALARSALEAGFEVTLTSRDIESTRLIVSVMAPGANVGTLAEAASADLVVLAVPLLRVQELPSSVFDGKILIDAINYWQPVDGDIERYGVAMARTSLLVRVHFPGARVVKSLNQLGYHDVEDGRRPPGAIDRLGVAVAGDDEDAVKTVAAFVDQLGFDPVSAGTLDEGQSLGPGGPAFGLVMTAPELKRALSLE